MFFMRINSSRKLGFDFQCTKRTSFILATKNRAKFLEKTLVECQKLIGDDDELIIIDGASKDNTLGVVNKYREIVDIFISEPDASSVEALNKGILISRGKYIKQLTDDDIVYPEAMEKALEVLEKHKEIDVLVCGGTKRFGKTVTTIYLPPGVSYGSRVEDAIKYGAPGISMVIRRRVFAKAGLFPDILAADVGFVMNCIAQGSTVKFCRVNLYNHPIYSHSVIIKSQAQWDKDCGLIIRKYLSFWIYLRYLVYKFLSQNAIDLGNLYKKVPILGIVLTPLRLFYRKWILTVSPVDLKGPNDVDRHVWDGGFS